MMATGRIVWGSLAVVTVAAAGWVAYALLDGSTPGPVAPGSVKQDGAVAPPDLDIPLDAAIPVAGQRVVRDTLVITVSAAGQTVAEQQATLLAQVDGPLTRVAVREDAVVRAGQVLFEIDSTEYALRVASARARVAQAEARYREMTMFDDQIPEPEVRAERSRVSRAKSGLDEAEVALAQARLEFTRAVVRAPFAGRIADLRVVSGQWVARQQELTTLVDLDPIRVQVQVTEHAVGLLRGGQSAHVSLAAFPNEGFDGRLATINPLVEPQARTVRVTVTVSNPRGRILPGMHARVVFDVQSLPGRILVPRAALLPRGTETVVLVYEQRGRAGIARERRVMTGQSNESLVEIIPLESRDVLEPGEVVLVDGHRALRSGTPVRLVTAPNR